MSRTRTWRATAAVGAATIGGVLTLTGADGAIGATGASGSTADRGTSQCRAQDVHASYHATDAATSHRFGRIVVTNTSGEPCSIRGYGGLSYVGGGDGNQIGAPADRVHSRVPRTVLQPGDRVASAISETVTAAYSASECRPTHVDGFRVYIPDETHSLYVAHSTTGCENDNVHLLTHKAFR